MAKYSKKLCDKCAAWVREHGLSLPSGSSGKNLKGSPTVADLCNAMGFSESAYYEWSNKHGEFGEAIAQAREDFISKTVGKLFNAGLVAAIGGYKDFERDEFEPDRNGQPRQKKKIREKRFVPPNVEAIKFYLKNLDPENWKDKQDTDVNLDVSNETPPVIMFTKSKPDKEGEGD